MEEYKREQLEDLINQYSALKYAYQIEHCIMEQESDDVSMMVFYEELIDTTQRQIDDLKKELNILKGLA